MIRTFLASALLTAALCWPTFGEEIPAFSAPLVDTAGLLDRSEADRIRQLIERVNSSGKLQLAVLITKSMDGHDIESYALRAFETWKPGKKGVDNGLLLVVAPNEKRMRFEVGYGLEGDIPDVIAKRILSDQMAPLFRQGRFSDGVQVAIAAVAERLGVDSGVAVERPRPRRRERGVPLIFLLFLLPIFIFISMFNGGRRSGYRSGGWGGGGWGGGGGFGGGGFGGGGFGGGGGGSSGGGGASSGW